MGVTGAGKTTVGQQLAAALGWTFVEGDAFHPSANVAKMHRGEPLDDADRAPWLRATRQRIDELVASAQSAVIACSALKRAYREVLARDRPEVTFVHLKASAALIAERLRHRAPDTPGPSTPTPEAQPCAETLCRLHHQATLRRL